jgi:acetamidase/formamidase
VTAEPPTFILRLTIHQHSSLGHWQCEPRFTEWIVFEGISVDETGKQHFLDASVAYKRAVLNAVDYLSKFGYTREQIYLLLSCAPSEGRISGIVDVPNACATLAVPIRIFSVDVRPKKLTQVRKLLPVSILEIHWNTRIIAP